MRPSSGTRPSRGARTRTLARRGGGEDAFGAMPAAVYPLQRERKVFPIKCSLSPPPSTVPRETQIRARQRRTETNMKAEINMDANFYMAAYPRAVVAFIMASSYLFRATSRIASN